MRFLESLTSLMRPACRRARRRISILPAAVDSMEKRLLLTPTVGVYDENISQPNSVDFVASGSTLTNTAFASNVAAAFHADFGGVIDGTSLSISGYEYGVSQNKSLTLVRADGTNYGIGGTGFNTNVESISESGAFVSASSGGFDFTSFEFVVNGAVDEHVVEFGVTVLSHSGRNYGNVSVIGRLSNGLTMSASRVISESEALGDTFFGLTAPGAEHFTGFSLEYDNPINAQLWFDDIGFRTRVPSPTVLEPAVEASIEDSDLDGRGNVFNAAPFTGLLSQNNGQEDRAIAEFNLSQYESVNTAVLDFELAVNNSLGGGTRLFDIFVYQGDGQSTLADFSVPGINVGRVGLVVSESRDTYQLDVTSAIQSVLAAQRQFAGVRIDPVNDSAPSILVSSTLTVDGTRVSTNQPPSINGQSFSIAEDAVSGELIGHIDAHEPDQGQSLTYQITAGNEAGLFSIDPNTGNLTIANGAALDYESVTRHVLTVVVTDDGSPNLSDSAGIAVNVIDVNDSAPVIWSNQVFTVPEDAPNGTVLGVVRVSDADTVGSLQDFAILTGNDDGIFAIHPDTGEITVADTTRMDFDVQASHVLGIRVSDGVQNSEVRDVTIEVEPLPAFTALAPVFRASIHDAPADGIGDSFNQSPFEGLLRQQSGTREDRAVAEFDLSTQETVTGGTLDFRLSVNNSLGTENRHFNIYLYHGNGQADLDDYSISGILVGSAVLPNFGSIDYSIDVSAGLSTILNGGASFVGVRVDPVNDSAPSIFGTPTLIVNLAPTLDAVADPAPVLEDAGQQIVTLTGISAGGREDQPLSVSAATSNSNLITALQVDYDSPDSTATLSYTPAANQSGTATVTVTVTDAGIDGTFGTADDNHVAQSFQVTVVPVNDAPEIPTGQTFSVDEHAPADTEVGIVDADDIENDPFVFEIVSGNESGAFTIDAATGRIRVVAANALDFEAQSQYTLLVSVTDANDDSLTNSSAVVINVLDVVEPSVVIEPIHTGKNARVSVSILSTGLFDATSEVDVSSLTLDVGGVVLTPAVHKKKGVQFEIRDVDGDGRDDLVVFFLVGDAQLQPATDVPTVLRGSLSDGTLFSTHSTVDILEGRKGGGRGKGKGNR